MGLLQTAGIVSGFGQGLGEGLKQMQTGITHYGLQEADRAFQSEKLKLQMEHAERLHAQTEAGATERQDKEIAAQAAEGAATRASAEANIGQQITSREAEAELQRASQEKIAGENRASQKEIAAAHDAATTAIHEADRTLKKHEIETSQKISTQTATTKALTEVGNEITRLSVVLKDPMLDRNSAEYKGLSERMNKLVRLHDGYTRSLALIKDEEPAKQRPPFKNQLAPTGSGTTVKPRVPSPAETGGVGLFDTPMNPEDTKTGSAMQNLP